MCMFIITGIIYCAEMMIAFKDESDEMIASYWRRIDAKSFDENRDLDGADEATVISVFQAMDYDKKGMVLLNEFCRFVEEQETEAGTAIGTLLTVGEEDAA